LQKKDIGCTVGDGGYGKCINLIKNGSLQDVVNY